MPRRPASLRYLPLWVRGRRARLMVAKGQSEADEELLAAARSILRDGGARPERQPAIPRWNSTPTHADEHGVGLRIWPERRNRPADGPPF